MRTFKFKLLLFMVTIGITGCTGIPSDLSVVDDFELDPFLGTWYEIARLNHNEERYLEKVTATYSKRDDGGIKVVNKGYHTQRQAWKRIEGKAYFNGPSNQGRLKVSFFGPFYGGYNVLKIEDDYSLAMISGPKRKYLWILARDKSVSQSKLDEYISQAKEWGFATEELILVAH